LKVKLDLLVLKARGKFLFTLEREREAERNTEWLMVDEHTVYGHTKQNTPA
jgi:hypothetical protein